MDVCGEIEYNHPDGSGRVHSDICIVHNGSWQVPPELRGFLHDALDEWLDKSRGSGLFWLGDPTELNERSGT